MSRVGLALAGALLLLAATGVPAVFAAFSGTTSNSGNSFATASLAAPTSLAVNQSCSPGPIPVRRSTGGSSFTSGTQTGTVTVVRPSGAQVGDVMIAGISWAGNATITDASGLWTPVFAPQLKDATMAQSVYYRVVTASEPANYAWTGPSAESGAGGIVAYSGVDRVTPVHITSGQIGASGTSGVAPSLTTTRANTMLVALWALAGTVTTAAPPGMTEAWKGTSGGSSTKTTSLAADEPRPTAGATGDRKPTVTSSRSIGQLVALQPPGTVSATTSWTPSSSSFATGQVFRRSSGGSVQRTATLGSALTSQTDGPLTSGTSYSVDVRATFGSWTSTTTAASFTALGC